MNPLRAAVAVALAAMAFVAAAIAPVTKSSESPGRNGQMTRPVSMNTIANNNAYTQAPCSASASTSQAKVEKVVKLPQNPVARKKRIS